MHDELQCPHKKELTDRLEKLTKGFENEYKKLVPLYEIEWKKGKTNWAETH